MTPGSPSRRPHLGPRARGVADAPRQADLLSVTGAYREAAVRRRGKVPEYLLFYQDKKAGEWDPRPSMAPRELSPCPLDHADYLVLT